MTESISLPPFEVTCVPGGNQTLQQLGKNLVLYFYPKDSTPGCTTEGLEFAALYDQFQGLNTEIIGVSRDSFKSHEKFIEKQGFPFPLISDPDEKLCRHFDVIQEKNMYGKKVLGVVRSTFVFDAQGNLIQALRGVKSKGHAQAMLELIQAQS